MKTSNTFAPGIAAKGERGQPTRRLKPGELVDYVLQHHRTKRNPGHPHYDLRLGTPSEGLYSWAIPGAKLPEGKERKLAPQTELHDYSYGRFSGHIPRGYGAGDVRLDQHGKAVITKVTPNTINFTVADSRVPVRYALVNIGTGKEGRDWLLISRPAGKDDVPGVGDKPNIRRISAEDLDSALEQAYDVQEKIDGAHMVYDIDKGGKLEAYSVRKSVDDKPIVHTERMGLGGIKRPELHDTTFRGEAFGIDPEGKAIPYHDTSGLLNAAIAKSLSNQRSRNISMKSAPFKVLRYRGEPIDGSPDEQRELVEKILAKLPENKFYLPERATTAEDARKLLERIRSGKNPVTAEGIMINTPKGPVKFKLRKERTAQLAGTYPGQGRRRSTAGGILAKVPGQEQPLRVGTGFTDSELEDIAANIKKYMGRPVRIGYDEELESGRLRAPSFQGFETDKPIKKKAQANNLPPWYNDEFVKRLWRRENAGRTGYDPVNKVYRTYKDMNRGKERRSAIGPGIVVSPDTRYTQDQMRKAIPRAVANEWNKTRERYPTITNYSPEAQKLLFDLTYIGAKRYPKLWDAIQTRNRQKALKEYHVHYTPPGGKKTKNKRRNRLNRDEYLNPMLETWGGQTNAVPAKPSDKVPINSELPFTIDSKPAPTNTVTLRQGETLSHIAKNKGIALEKLLKANRNKYPNPRKIPAGAKIVLPKPRKMDKSSQDDATKLRKQITQAGKKTETNPSKEQAEAGNYKKGHIRLHGMDITIENPKGSTRSGVSADGKKWSTRMKATYGYIKRTESDADGDHVDVFIGAYPQCRMVFVIDQTNPDTGTFDEHKCVLGCRTEDEAKQTYLANYTKGWQGFGDIRALSLGEFKDWLQTGDTGKPVAKQFKKYAKVSKGASIKQAENGWHGVDLDATLATYDKWRGHEHIGRPIKHMCDRIKRWLNNGEQVKILTTRANNGDNAIKMVQDWTYAHFGRKLPVTATKNKHMIDVWDDRAHRVSQNTGEKVADMVKHVPLQIVTPEKSEIKIKFTAEMADTPRKRAKGLSKRANLPENHGMLFDVPGPFWMKDVSIPLEIMFLTKQGEILDRNIMRVNWVPDSILPRYRSKYTTAAYALEMPAGWTDKHNVHTGDKVEIDNAVISRL